MFTAALCTITKKCLQFKHLLTDERINKSGICNKVLFSNKKKWSSDTQMNEPWKDFAEWKKPDATYMKYPEKRKP